MRALLSALGVFAAACAGGPADADEACSHQTTISEARYANADISLAAAWISPIGVTQTPAVIILQGAGDSSRSNAWSAQIAAALAECGVAVLLTDKRGSGASTGDWRTASMLDLAADGAAGLVWAAAQPNVDRDRIGFLGLSQGGMVAPAAALLSPEADFAIGWVSSAAPMRDVLTYELEQTYRQHGLNDEQIAPLQRLPHAAFTWLDSGESWADYVAVRDAIAQSPFARAAETWPSTQDDSYWTFWRANKDYAALPRWRELVEQRHTPGLVVLGELDVSDNVDVAGTRDLLRAGVRGAMLVEVVPGVGHSLRLENGALHPRALGLTLSLVRNPQAWPQAAASMSLPAP
ncbi:MAG: alpha/beta hydrolase family protein [Hyphomonadaceae bacterium]